MHMHMHMTTACALHMHMHMHMCMHVLVDAVLCTAVSAVLARAPTSDKRVTT